MVMSGVVAHKYILLDNHVNTFLADGGNRTLGITTTTPNPPPWPPAQTYRNKEVIKKSSRSND
jgi:hypothetical protein